MFGQVWYTIGDRLNYRWVDIAAAYCYHKYGTLLGSSWTTGELILQLPVVITNTVHYRGAVELQVSWYCSCLLLSQTWYTTGEQLNYRWVYIAAACCYHKHGTLLGCSWTTDELILQLPVVITNMVHYRGAVELQVSWYCSCLLLSQI